MNPIKFQFERFEQEKQRLASLRKYEPLIDANDEDLDKLVKIAAYICQTPISLVNLVEANHTIFKATIGTDLKGSPREISFCSKAITGSGVYEISDATIDDRFKNNPLVTGPTQIKFYAGSPLLNRDGMNMGTLCVFDIKPKVLLPEQKDALTTLGKMAMMIMENRKQAAVLQKGNLSAVLSLESRITELMKQLEGVRKFLPKEVAAAISPKDLPSYSSAVLKDMVILQCTINNLNSDDENAEVNLAYLSKVYTMISNVVANFNGLVHHFDGRHITSVFSEPLSTFPYEENALYCACDLIEQFSCISPSAQSGNPATLAISLHNGKVISGLVALATRIDYTLSGSVLEESKLIRDSIDEYDNAVYVSSQFYNSVNHAIDIVQKFSIENQSKREVYKVVLSQ